MKQIFMKESNWLLHLTLLQHKISYNTDYVLVLSALITLEDIKSASLIYIWSFVFSGLMWISLRFTVSWHAQKPYCRVLNSQFHAKRAVLQTSMRKSWWDKPAQYRCQMVHWKLFVAIYKNYKHNFILNSVIFFSFIYLVGNW